MLVVKFGGSSVGDAAGIARVATIIADLQSHEPVTVVVSAMAGVTDDLLAIARSAMAGDASSWASARNALDALGDRHRAVFKTLGVAIPAQFDAAWRACEAAAASLNQPASDSRQSVEAATNFSGWGERLMVEVLAAVVRTRGIAAEAFVGEPVVLASLAQGAPQPEPSLLATRAWLGPRLASLFLRDGIPIVPGYIARDAHQEPTTLGRNGSDYSAAIIAAALGASRLIIFSDVPGIFSADPRLVSSARLIPWVTYDEAARIAHAGAQVLHPRTVEPLARWQIPLELRATQDPYRTGTTILPAGAPGHRVPGFVVANRALDAVRTCVTVAILDGKTSADYLAMLLRRVGEIGQASVDPTSLEVQWIVPSATAITTQIALHQILLDAAESASLIAR